MEIHCSRCQKPFNRVPSAINPTANYCSIACRKEPLEKTCEACGKTYTVHIAHRKHSRFCSRSCAKSGENHPYWGKVGPTKGMAPWTKGLTVDTDERVAALGKKISEKAKADYASGKRERLHGAANPNYGKKPTDRTPEQLERYSKAAIERIKTFNFCKGHFQSTKANKAFLYRSSYELRMMACLEKDPDVVHWEFEPFSIKYQEGKRYLPDFIARRTSKTEIIETKNKYNRSLESTSLKEQAAITYCQERGWTYRIMTLEDIVDYEQTLGISL